MRLAILRHALDWQTPSLGKCAARSTAHRDAWNRVPVLSVWLCTLAQYEHKRLHLARATTLTLLPAMKGKPPPEADLASSLLGPRLNTELLRCRTLGLPPRVRLLESKT